MNVLVLGGTRFFGIHMVNSLLSKGHNVTIATRGMTKDVFGQNIERLFIERTSADSLSTALSNKFFDVVCDNLAYCSNDVKFLLDSLNCGRYVMTSSASVYIGQHLCTQEKEFDPFSYPLKWCYRQEFTYDEIKRQAECALFQYYSRFPGIAVRFPFVIGEDDYTQRLYFYVEHIIKGTPIFINNLDEKISFIRSVEAGNFIAWIAEKDFIGSINGNNGGTITLQEIIKYVEERTGKKVILSYNGLVGPFNGQKSFSLDNKLANDLGYYFTDLKEWIYNLIDKYIERTLSH